MKKLEIFFVKNKKIDFLDKLNLRFIHGDDGLDSDRIMNSETGIDNEFLETFHQNEQQDLLHLLRQKE